MRWEIIIGIIVQAPRASKLALLALASAAIAGCGHTAGAGSDRTLSVALSEYKIDPSNVRVSAGELIIDVHNYGRLNHDLVISQNGRTTGQIKPLPPGQSAVLAVDLAPGTYSMTSTILSDQALGAYGTLKVSK
jgi:plastocyanin